MKLQLNDSPWFSVGPRSCLLWGTRVSQSALAPHVFTGEAVPCHVRLARVAVSPRPLVHANQLAEGGSALPDQGNREGTH